MDIPAGLKGCQVVWADPEYLAWWTQNCSALSQPAVALQKREGAETRHYNCILRAQAIWMGVHNARKLLNDMIEGRTGGKRRVLPDINSYNALIEVRSHLLTATQGWERSARSVLPFVVCTTAILVWYPSHFTQDQKATDWWTGRNARLAIKTSRHLSVVPAGTVT